jgi:hypothetical protein
LVDNKVWRITREEIMPVVDPRLAGKPVPKISREAMKRSHVARAAKARAPISLSSISAFPPMSARSSTWSAWA